MYDGIGVALGARARQDRSGQRPPREANSPLLKDASLMDPAVGDARGR